MAFLQGIIVKILIQVFGNLIDKATQYIEMRIEEQRLKKDIKQKIEEIFKNEKDAQRRAQRISDMLND